jgi:5-methylcytosine-specific restriction endonuclease McrA
MSDIHLRAVQACARLKRAESDVIDALIEVERHRVHLQRGHASLFVYAVRDLKLPESVAYAFITVARKSREVPELRQAIAQGAITLSHARRIASVLTRQNQAEWLHKAATLSQRQLEKEVVRVRPREATREHATYVTPTRVRLEVGLSEAMMLKLRRVQDLLSQRRQRPVSLEEALEEMVGEYLHRNDPVEKARRHIVRARPERPEGEDLAERPERPRARPQLSSARVPLRAATRHRVTLRDQGRCTYVANGRACGQTRWIEIHHRTPISQGGTNTVENLQTLCAVHHRQVHGHGT